MRLNLLTIADGCRLEFIAERGKKNDRINRAETSKNIRA